MQLGLHFLIVLELGTYTPQYSWLEEELPKVNREETPWLIVIVHSPWYNSNNYHYMEGESMRVMFESWFVQYKVDLVFAGHVHAYERTVSFRTIFSLCNKGFDLLNIKMSYDNAILKYISNLFSDTIYRNVCPTSGTT